MKLGLTGITLRQQPSTGRTILIIESCRLATAAFGNGNAGLTRQAHNILEEASRKKIDESCIGLKVSVMFELYAILNDHIKA